jgi:hypothetical protein
VSVASGSSQPPNRRGVATIAGIWPFRALVKRLARAA